MPNSTPPKLNANLRQACGRLAVERLRREQWALAADLRRQAVARMASGADSSDVLATIQNEIKRLIEPVGTQTTFASLDDIKKAYFAPDPVSPRTRQQ